MLNPSRVLSTLTLAALTITPVAAQATETSFETDELIVLLDTNTETVANDLAPRERLRRVLPKTLANGSLDARFLIQRRSQGSARERLVAEHDSAAALLERYLVLRYPTVIDVEAMAHDLREQPGVLFVRPNHRSAVSAVIPERSTVWSKDHHRTNTNGVATHSICLKPGSAPRVMVTSACSTSASTRPTRTWQ